MRFQLLFWLLLLLPVKSDGQRLSLDGREVFINGINLPWRHYGQDFGRARDGKYYYNRDYYHKVFSNLQEHGVNTIRIWLHCNGRHSPLLGKEQETRGLPERFVEDFIDFLDLANTYELLVIPVLWSFEMVDHGKSKIISDYQTTISFIDHALIPLVSQTKERCNILAWEIINEPEWAMDIPFAGTMENVVSPGNMQRFVALCADAIHTHSNQMVTIGSAGLRFLTNQYIYAYNYWHDTELSKESVACSTAYLDFYSVHYYKKTLENLSPHKQSWSSLSLGRPVLVSEFGGKVPALEFMKGVFKNGYAGAVPWSYAAGDGFGRWDDYQKDLAYMAEEHHSLMPIFPMCTYKKQERILQSCLLYPNPASEYFIVENHSGKQIPVRVELMNVQGQSVMQDRTNLIDAWQVDVKGLSQGVYIVRIFSTDDKNIERHMSTQRLIITN